MTALLEQLASAGVVLSTRFGYPDFRPAQRRVVQAVIAGHDTLAVLPTGGGKSICFQVPALVLGGVTIVVSPLISLMQDQVEALQRRGLPAALLNSTLAPAEAAATMRRVIAGEVALLYVSPERLASLAADLRCHDIRPRLLAIDEAHCISEWGPDFRPQYRQIARARYLLGQPQVVALTGSATPEVREDIAGSLRLKRPRVILGSFDRANLWFGVVRVRGDRERLWTLETALRRWPGLSIVYAATRGQTELVTEALRMKGFRAVPYHAGLDAAARERILHQFLAAEVDVVVATSAFGMGIDQPRVRLVVHWTISPTMESYYQEAGRAGRDGGASHCIVLFNSGDLFLARRQLGVTFPPRAMVEAIWQKRIPPGTPAAVIESAERLRRELHPRDGPVDWAAVRERHRRALGRLAIMESYAGAARCRRGMILDYFGERLDRCSGCDRCDGMPAGLAPPSRWRELARRLVTGADLPP